mgnify:CR=1 FL=1
MIIAETMTRNYNKGYKLHAARSANIYITHMTFIKQLRHSPDIFRPEYWLKFPIDLERELTEILRLMKHNLSMADIERFKMSLGLHKSFLSTAIFQTIKLSIASGKIVPYERKKKPTFSRTKMLLGEDGEYYAQGFLSNMLTVKHEVTIPQLTKTFDAVEGFVDPNNPNMRKFYRQAIICFVGLVNSENYITRVTNVLAFLNAFDCVGNWVEKYAQEVAQVFKPPSTHLVAQANTANGEYLMMGTIKLLLNMFNKSSDEMFSIDEKRSKRIQNLARACTSMSSLVKFLTNLVTESVKYVKAIYLGVDVNVIDLMEYEIDIRKWHSRIHEIVVNDGMLLAARDSELASEIKRLYDQGVIFQEMLLKARIPRNIAEVFYKTFQTLSIMHKETLAFCGYDRIRPSPFVLHIFGASGVGKSTMMDFLLRDVYRKKNVPFSRQHDIYVRNSVQSFWDGYKNQKVVLFDDFMQSQVENDLAQILVELVRCKNTMAFPLQMASLEHKGNTRFTSEFIYVSSNKDIPENISCILDAQAIRRRRDLVVEAVVKTEFLTAGVVDPDKIAAFMDTQPYMNVDGVEQRRVFCPDIYQFKVYTKGSENNAGKFTQIVWNWDQLVENIVKDWDKLAFSEKAIEREVAYNPVSPSNDNFVSILQESLQAPPEVAREIKWSYHYGFDKIKGITHPLVDRWNNMIVPVKTSLDELYEYFASHAETLRAITAITSLVGMATLAWSLMSKNSEPEAEFVSGDQRTSKVTRWMVSSSNVPKKVPYKAYTPDTHMFRAESSEDPNGFDVLRRKIAANHLMLDFFTGDTNSRIVGLAVCGRAVVCPSHAFSCTTDNTQIDIRRSGNLLLGSCFIRELEVCELPDCDLTLFILPKHFQLFQDIRHHISDGILSKMPLNSSVLFTMVRDGESIMHQTTVVPYLYTGGRIKYSNNGDQITIAHHLKYNVPTEVGDCGSLLYILNKNCTRKIIGLHVAGNNEFGVSTLLNVNLINDALSRMDSGPNLVGAEFSMECCQDPSLIAHAKALTYCGEIHRRYQQRQPTKTDIQPSLLYNRVFSAETAPSLLSPVGDINPLIDGIMKSDKPPILFPRNAVYRALCDMKGDLLSLPKEPPDRKILTVHQAINGDPNDLSITSLNLKSSPGFPFVHYKTKKRQGKFSFFNELPNCTYEPTNELQERIDLRLEAAKQGQIIPVIFYDILKDERRSLEKVHRGETRVFSVGPLDLNILIRMYFGRAISFLQRNCVGGECSVGINPHGTDWRLLYMDLTSFSDNFIQGDYGAFDKLLPYQLIESVYSFFKDFYQDEYEVERYTLYLSIFSCYRLAGRQVYKPLGGNPSGNPLTVIVNSLCNMMLVRLAFFQTFPNHMAPMSQSIKLKVYGDDLVMGVAEESEQFTFRVFQKFLNDAGLVFKEPKKTAMVYDFVPIDKVEYLKRMFVKNISGVMAPLDLRSITEMVNWIRSCEDPRLALKLNLDVVRRELVYHGEDLYNDYYSRIVKAAGKIKLGVAFTPYLDSLREWQSNNQ